MNQQAQQTLPSVRKTITVAASHNQMNHRAPSTERAVLLFKIDAAARNTNNAAMPNSTANRVRKGLLPGVTQAYVPAA